MLNETLKFFRIITFDMEPRL